MKKQILSLIAFTFLVFSFVSVSAVGAQTRVYTATDSQVQTLLNRIETRTDTYKSAMDTALDRSRYNNTNQEDSIAKFISDFEVATDLLKQRFNARGSAIVDVENVLGRANYIQDFMQRNRLTAAVQNQWRNIYFDLNTLASYYRINWNRTVGSYPWTSPVNPPMGGGSYTVPDRTLQTLLNRLDMRGNNFRTAVRRNRNDATLNSYVADYENALRNLRSRFDSRTSSSADVQDVLSRAATIDSYIRSMRLNQNVNSQWNLVRSDLNTLASYYNVSWNWNNPSQYPTTPYAGLNGTYRLNVGASDNVLNVVDRAIGTLYANNQRERIRRNLERRLTPPQMIAIENVNRQFTLASSNSPQVTLRADGTTTTETMPNGRTIRVRAESVGNNVNIAYEGDRTNDFYVTFEPVGTNQLRVTRRVYLENRNEQVSAVSIYDRTSATADWSMVNNNSNVGGVGNNPTLNEFLVPNGTRMTAVLTTPLSTKTVRPGDRFAMEVRSPSQYQGAIIEGAIAEADRSGRVSGRAELLLNFEQIRLRNGQVYRFSGLIDSVRNEKGDTVNINNEGVVRDNNQTTKTVTRAGIGAAIGAIIGAIAGGGSGAAIGAGIGAGAGAGSVVLQGRDDLELNMGTEFNLTSSAPANLRVNQ